MKDVLPLSASSSADGHLMIGGLDTVDLADEFGTPLIVFDRATFEGRAKTYTSALDPAQVHYAGKSFCCVAVCELVDQLGLSLDVCTGGELATALAAGFPAERITFHGNNKSEDELRAAQVAGVGRVVVDSFDEIDRLARCGVKTKLMIRVTPGVEAHTHEFVQTGQEDSKFGFSLHDGVALEAIKRASEVPGCDLAGLHAHIGSQIFELAAFDLAIERLAGLAAEAKRAHGFDVRELNVGGGLGIAHTRDEMTPDPAEAVERMSSAIAKSFGAQGLPVPQIFVEPGRSIVGSSAVTLYRIGTVKRIPGVRTYVSMDGGMSDNIRPALYSARYEAFLANRMDAPEGPRVTVAGKHCESGDILIKDVHLPDDIAPGDLLCVPATGAYTYSMASNYNRVPRPAVVMVHEGRSTVIQERETVDDLLRLDRRLDGSPL
ncbi:MAG: diaminopimelate decarboxylase [Actinomycetota bacterium]|jgi:diaminopimelate decarboxylase|nr:diaminopimelate decarboxylase [Actinomycetota bacterium]